ncbi:MAG: S-methyl-5'-thioinosine phosphorylase [Gammaproteobacteria bacterium]|nr:MAG: S-methyl-5'-thioinosine phosphorylase [Gammaproteobacteria bacterium]
MKRVALIGGTGAGRIVPETAHSRAVTQTRWGRASAATRVWEHGDLEVVFLPRHGEAGAIPPHKVNYRANIECLRALAPAAVIGINAVGGITPPAWPGRLVLPDQLIDYTWGREHTFSDGANAGLQHVEFDPPFDEALRSALAQAALAAGVDVLATATYGVTQGPRLETAAEIDRLAADGCDIVGMTAMPEAALAREAGLRYAVCAVVVNRAAGRLAPGATIHGDMGQFLDVALGHAGRALRAWFEMW